MSFRRGWLFSLVLVTGAGLMLPSQPAQALDWRDLWKTRDQQGAEAFVAEEHATAAVLFESTEWTGAASYRAENYEAAVAAYSDVDTQDGHYNRGNALAVAGNYAEAIAAYDLALGLNANLDDAIYNRGNR